MEKQKEWGWGPLTSNLLLIGQKVIYYFIVLNTNFRFIWIVHLPTIYWYSLLTYREISRKHTIYERNLFRSMDMICEMLPVKF